MHFLYFKKGKTLENIQEESGPSFWGAAHHGIKSAM